jgi:tRNA-splicing ligase RtcB
MDRMSEIPITVRGDVDARAVEQLRRCAQAGDAVAGALCADGHVGYSQPIGGVVAYPDHISPSGVGYDIACGNKAVRTDLRVEDVRPDLPRLMDEIVDRVSFGVGRRNDEPVDHPVLDRILEADFAGQRALHGLAAEQLGTVGAGNHYVDLFAGDDGLVWVGVHFGSRGFGHRTASGFLSLAAGGRFDQPGRDGEMDAPPVLLHVDSDLGQGYLSAMQLAGEYAYAGRDVVTAKVLEILGGRETYAVHNHHNFAWRERHFGQDVWVIRKGCTPAFPGQEGFVGATMGEPSVVLRGTEDPGGEGLLRSTVHGAGRVMSRARAAGRIVKRAQCTVRDCDVWVPWRRFVWEREQAGVGERDPFTVCPRHPGGRMAKRRGPLGDGLIDFDAVRADLSAAGIELRGGAADEAPGAYKRLDEVLAAHGDTVEVLHRLTPIGVAMAAPDTFDPYKD